MSPSVTEAVEKINKDNPPAVRYANAAELKAEQDAENALPNPFDFDPEEAVMVASLWRDIDAELEAYEQGFFPRGQQL